MSIPSEELINTILGQDFLTWIWFCSENNSISFYDRDRQCFSVCMEQKVVVQGGEGESLEIASVSGTYSSLKEARFGLQVGKKVIHALIFFEKMELSWKVFLKAEKFSLSGVTTPKIMVENDESDTSFLEKMYLIETGLSCLDSCYRLFLEKRLSSDWLVELQYMAQWILQSKDI